MSNILFNNLCIFFNILDQVYLCAYYTFKGRTASGEPYRTNNMTAAHQHLPFNTTLLVKYKDQQVVVRINDRGPYNNDQILNLSFAAANKLKMLPVGIDRCEVKIIKLMKKYPTTTPDYNSCLYLFSDKCVRDDDCCSQYCEKLTGWITGVCKSKIELPTIEQVP